MNNLIATSNFKIWSYFGICTYVELVWCTLPHTDVRGPLKICKDIFVISGMQQAAALTKKL